MSRSLFVASIVALSIGGSVAAQRGGGAGPVRFPTPEQFKASSEAQRIVADAKQYAGTDLQWHYTNVCSSMGPQRVALALQAAGQTLKDYTVEPTKVFDNVWYVGLASQGAFVITTSEGLILIDTLNTTAEARDIIVPGMKKAGLDPAQIKYIVLSHGHPGQTDHTGGASWFQATYKPRILMAKEDWDATLPAQRAERPLAKRDMDITHGQTLTLGDTTLTFTTLFGHSDGSLGIFIPVKWRGQPSVVWLHGGGLHHPTRASLARLEEAVNKYARPMGAEALLNTHPGLYQDTIADMEAIRKNPNGPNPILLGRERANRYWSMVLDCARARVIALEDAAVRGDAQSPPALIQVGEDRGPGQWTEFASPADRFTANFPGRPAVTDTTWTSEFGAELKGRVYAAQAGAGEYRITAIDYSPIEAELTAKAQGCPQGAETCRGGGDTGVGYWKNDLRGVLDYAAWSYMRRPGVRVTHYQWNFQDMVAGRTVHLRNANGTRTFVAMYFHDQRLIVVEGTVPDGYPEPGLFLQAIGWLDQSGRGIRYATVYYPDPDLPKPALHQRSFISDFGRIDATGIR